MSARRTRSEAFSLFAFQDIITSVTGVIVLIMLLLTLELIQRKRITPTPGTAAAVSPLLRTIKKIDRQIATMQETLLLGKSQMEELASLPIAAVQRQQQMLQFAIERLKNEVGALKRQQQHGLLQQNVLEAANSKPGGAAAELSTLIRHIAALHEQLKKLKNTDRVIYNPNAKTSKRGWLVDLSANLLQVAEVGLESPPIIFDQNSSQRRIDRLLTWARTRNPRTEYFILLIRPNAVESYEHIRKELENLGFDLGFDLLGSHVTVIDPVTGAVFSQ